jgi:predicted SnoaL-like aldol condensation-catalyzing enzyme
MTMFRLQDGKIVEEWNVFDNYSLLTQLGLLAKPAG